MWKIFLGFVFHRMVLYGISLVVISFALSARQRDSLLPPFAPIPDLHARLLSRVAELPEVKTIVAWSDRKSPLVFSQLLAETHSPFLWLGIGLARLSGLTPILSAIILSNLFFLLLLSELFRLLSRISSRDVASLTGLLVVFWPTSYELSLGSALSAEAYWVVLATRLAVDDKWLFCGLSLGLAAITDRSVVGMLPLLLCWFWFYSRHYQWTQIVKRTLYLGIPVGIVLVLSYSSLGQLSMAWQSSAFMSLFSGVKSANLKWILSQSALGQSLAIVFLGVGAAIASASNFSLLNRATPVYFFMFWLLFSPYGTLASKAPLAGVCFQGIATATTNHLNKLILLAFLSAGVYEIFLVFG